MQLLDYRWRNSKAGLARATATKPRATSLVRIVPKLGGFDQQGKDLVGRRVPVLVWTRKDLTTLRQLASVVVTKGAIVPTRGVP